MQNLCHDEACNRRQLLPKQWLQLGDVLMKGVYADCRLNFGQVLVFAHKLILSDKLLVLCSFAQLESLPPDPTEASTTPESVNSSSGTDRLPTYTVLAEPLSGYDDDSGSWEDFVRRFWSFVYGACSAPRQRCFETLCTAVLLDRLLCVEADSKLLGWTDCSALPPMYVIRSRRLTLRQKNWGGIQCIQTKDTKRDRVFLVIRDELVSRNAPTKDQVVFTNAFGTASFRDYFVRYGVMRNKEDAYALLMDSWLQRRGASKDFIVTFEFQPELMPHGTSLVLSLPESKRDLRMDLSRHFVRSLFGVSPDFVAYSEERLGFLPFGIQLTDQSQSPPVSEQ
jgi:hypothetical protein